jgi:fluoride exporter
MKLMQIAALSLGGVLGVNARYWLGLWVNRWASQTFPWATFLINATGSFAIGLLATLLVRWLPHENARLFVITGFLGGYTTYSSFAYESLTLWERGERGQSIAYISFTVLAGFVAVFLGVALGRELTVQRAERAAARDVRTDAAGDGTTQVPAGGAEEGS